MFIAAFSNRPKCLNFVIILIFNNQVWSWDITWLPSPIRGMNFYLYMIVDLLAKQKRPDRWSGKSRDWEPIQKVWLNCPKDAETQLDELLKVA
jgi:hypothetical protein